MRKLIFLLAFSLLLATSASARTKLAISKSTMQLGGTIQMPISIPKGRDAVVGISVSPEFSYFVGRSFALGINPSAGRSSLSGDGLPWQFSVAGTAKYYIDLGGALYPYLGAKAGLAWETKKEGVNFLLGAPLGVLVPLNNHVALDVGAPLNFYFDKKGYAGAHIPVGYLGVAAFF